MIATKPLHLISLEIENVMGIKALTIDAQGKHVIVSGPNGSGKSSTLDALALAIEGPNSRWIPEPVRKGATEAAMLLDLGNLVIHRVIRNGKTTKLTVTPADGQTVSRAQDLLDGLLGRYSFDPVAFLARRPQDQIDDVLNSASVKPPVARVKEICGDGDCIQEPLPDESADHYLLRLSADPGTPGMSSDGGTYYGRRREANRVLTAKEAAVVEQRRQLDMVGGPIKPNEDPGTVTDKLAEIDRLQAQADRFREANALVGQERTALQKAEDAMAGLAADEQRLQHDIEAMTQRLASMKAEQAKLQARIENGKGVVAEIKADYQTALDAAVKIKDPAPQIASLRTACKEWEGVSQRFAKRRAAAEQLERLGADAAAAKAEHERLDKVLSALRYERMHLLDGVDLGVPGLSIGNGELLLNGVPFRQASQAEQIKVACCVAMRQEPPLRILRVDEAERLDSQSLALLLELASKQDPPWQVLCARVADTKALKVEIVEQEAAA